MMRIKVAKVVNDNGERCYTLLKVEMLTKDKLPSLYFKKPHHCYAIKDGFKLASIRTKKDPKYPSDYMPCLIGEIFLENKWNEILQDMKFCGVDLAKTKAELLYLQKDWQGEVTYTI